MGCTRAAAMPLHGLDRDVAATDPMARDAHVDSVIRIIPVRKSLHACFWMRLPVIRA